MKIFLPYKKPRGNYRFPVKSRGWSERLAEREYNNMPRNQRKLVKYNLTKRATAGGHRTDGIPRIKKTAKIC